MKIVIKGAGDLATGIASRLYHARTSDRDDEIAVPLTVRRSVALSRAVYENEAEVEDLKRGAGKGCCRSRQNLTKRRDSGTGGSRSRYYQVVSSGCSSGCNPGKEESGNPDHGCAVCHRCRTGILRRKRLSLCHRDKKRTYTGKCDLGKRSNPKYRSSGKYRRLYNRASDPCQCRWNHGACGRNRRYRRKRPACCQDREAAGLCKDERNCPRNAPEECTGHRRIEDRRH